MRPPVGAAHRTVSFGTVRLVAAVPRCRNARVALRVDNHAQADFDAVVKCLGVCQAQVDATVAAAPLVRLGIIEALVVLPCSVVEADHIALERHPVAHRALVFGLTGLGVLGSDQGAATVVAVNLPHALGGGVFAGLPEIKLASHTILPLSS